MEVAPLPDKPSEHHSSGGLRVEKSSEVGSKLITELQHGTRIQLLATVQLSDQTKRAFVALQGKGAKGGGSLDSRPLGWVTATTKDGIPMIYRFARPIYEVVVSPKVRKEHHKSSRSVGCLISGTKIHVVESHRHEDGSLRAHIIVLGQDKPMGWITLNPAWVREYAAASTSAAATTPSAPLRTSPTLRDSWSLLKSSSGGGSSSKLKGMWGKVKQSVVSVDSESTDFASVVKSAVKELAVPGSALKLSSSHDAVERATTECLALIANIKKITPLEDYERICSDLEKKAATEENTTEDSSLAIRIGAELAGKKTKMDELVREWDPNGDGSVTKQEFR